MSDDFLGAKPMPRPEGLTRPAMPSEMGNAPFRLEQDDRGQWVLMLNDGHGNVMEAVLPDETVDALARRILDEPARRTVPGLEVQVTAVVNSYMGDHAEFIRKPLTYSPTETVEALLDRAHGLTQPYARTLEGDRVELQVIPETVPEVKTATAKDPWSV